MDIIEWACQYRAWIQGRESITDVFISLWQNNDVTSNTVQYLLCQHHDYVKVKRPGFSLRVNKWGGVLRLTFVCLCLIRSEACLTGFSVCLARQAADKREQWSHHWSPGLAVSGRPEETKTSPTCLNTSTSHMCMFIYKCYSHWDSFLVLWQPVVGSFQLSTEAIIPVKSPGWLTLHHQILMNLL